MEKILRFTLFAATVVIIIGGFSSCTETTRIEVSDIRLDKSTADIARGSTLVLTAMVSPDNATDYTITWTSSEPSVATVSREGTVSALAIGTTTISAEADGKIALCRVNVVGKAAESVTVSPSLLTIRKGETTTLEAEIFPADADNRTITWNTADSSIAIVSQQGEVTAIAPGTVTVSATCGDAVGECSVTVEGIPAESISISPNDADVLVGENIRLTATVFPDNADYEPIYWSTSDVSIATISPEGTVTGVAAGEVTITARTGDIEGTATITVVLPQAKVGDFYYSDGTWSTELNTQKQVIGMIFHVGQHQNDVSDYSQTGIGKSRCNGYVMALTNATEEYCWWGPEDGSDLGCYPVDENGNIVDNYSKFKDCDWSGYKYTRIIEEAAKKNGGPAPDQAVTYPVIYWTLEYENAVPSPASSSGWFLPAISQIWTLIENRDLLGKAGAELPANWYYSSSEDSWALNMVLSINMDSMTCRSNWKESKVNLIRPILAF